MVVTIVVPFYNEEKAIQEFYHRLNVVTENLRNYRFEFLFVNDGSRDLTLPLIKELVEKDPRVKLIDFSRNFGHQAAILAGIENSTGNAVIVIDGDLQDPPELIPRLIHKWREGYDVVYARRAGRRGESLFKTITAYFFYRFINLLSDIEIPKDVGDFRLMDIKVLQVLKKLDERNIFIRGLVSWLGFKQTYVEYERDKRYAGRTKYSIYRMINFALEGITSFSLKPLRIALSIGFSAIFVGIILFIYIMIKKFLNPEMVITGWTSLITSVIFFGGVQLFTIGIVGEYIGKIYTEVKMRPRYIIRQILEHDGKRNKPRKKL